MPISMKFTFCKRCKDQTWRCSEITQENFKINKNCNKATKNSSCHSFLVKKPFFLLMKTSETFFRYKNWEFLEEYGLREFIKTLLFFPTKCISTISNYLFQIWIQTSMDNKFDKENFGKVKKVSNFYDVVQKLNKKLKEGI